MIQLASKSYLFLLLIIPLLILWRIYLDKKGKRFILFSSRTLIPTAGKSAKTPFIKSLFYVKIVVLVIIIVALARPQILNFYEKENKKGVSILITLDTSGSMAAMDFKPKNRLEVAKDVISDFIKKRQTDQLGLVVFAGTCYTKCPPTIDYDMLEYFLEKTNIKELEDGTALGMALATSVNRILKSKSRTKIVILLTDGVNNRGEIDPKDAAQFAKEKNIKVYTIGVGTRGEAPYPVVDAYGRQHLQMMPVQLDEELLQEIANNTGGLYYRATDKESLKQIFSEIDRWEKTEITTKRYYNAKDIYWLLLLFALSLLFLAEFAKRTFLRTLP